MPELPEVVRRHFSRAMGGEDHPDAGLLTALIEGTLTQTHRAAVFDHLVACSECNRLVALIAPEREVTSAVQPVEARRRWFTWTPVRWAAVGAALAVVIIAVVIGRIDRQTVVPGAPSARVEQVPTASMSAQLPVLVQPRTSRPSSKPAQPASHARQGVPSQPALSRGAALAAAQSRPAASGDVLGENAFQTSMMSDPSAWAELSPSTGEPPTVKPEPAPAASVAAPALPTGPTEPMWSLSEAGMLQKSNDRGHTWAAVAVPSRVPLHALSVLGQEIWIGGDQGTLYHSTDAGQSWTAVVPTANGVPVSADIMRIAFADQRHGWIATRNGEIWKTRDSGATWSLK